ncbi:MAG: hypothetical protein J1E35_00315 [Lachnospiraceae bacterium]|nr:hypothetical protein [Lachnospiraceae bacterium]
MYKVYCGKDAAIVENDDLSIIFLRVGDENLISMLKHSSIGIVGIVSGYGRNFEAHADYCFINPETGMRYCTRPEFCDELEKHKKDTVCTNDAHEMIYTTYNGSVYRLQIAEELETDEIRMTDEEIQKMSLSDKMRMWNCGKEFECFDFAVHANINTERYSAIFNVNASNNLYCRFGMHGYCDKGYAMLSTICIRQNECRMIPDNTEALKGYVPNEGYFADNSCAFPADGSWYWSVRNVDDSTVYLNGCGGDIYKICRR